MLNHFGKLYVKDKMTNVKLGVGYNLHANFHLQGLQLEYSLNRLFNLKTKQILLGTAQFSILLQMGCLHGGILRDIRSFRINIAYFGVLSF